jgi:enoyl-CoA hydratase
LTIDAAPREGFLSGQPMITLTLDAPGKNALSTEMMESIIGRLDHAAGQPVLFVGANDAFSAGLNLKELASLEGDRMFAFLDLLERCMTAIYLYPGPTVACVNGHAIAGGCVITLCCDHRIITDNERVRIGLNEVALGVRFPPRILSIVRRRVASQSLDRVVLGADLFSPAAALALGLVDEVVSDPLEAARVRASTLGSYVRGPYVASKRDLRGTENDLYPEADHARMLRSMVPEWTTKHVRDRIAAALAKR